MLIWFRVQIVLCQDPKIRKREKSQLKPLTCFWPVLLHPATTTLIPLLLEKLCGTTFSGADS